MTLQDAGLLLLALFPFTLVGVAAVSMIRKRMKNKTPKLELVKEMPRKVKMNAQQRIDLPDLKPKARKKKRKQGKRK